MAYKEIVINNFKELQSLDFPEYWNFRGQTQDWKLKTSIEVLLDKFSLDYYWYIDSLTNFRQEFSDKYKKATQKELKPLENLALMQHYGLKTELLDVTEDINIALYFAIENDNEKDGVIWAFNQVQLYKNNIINGFIKSKNLSNTEIKIDYSSKNITELGKSSNFICSVNLHDFQKLNNERIKRQKGRFLLAPNFYKSNSNSLWSYSNAFCGFENGLFYSYGMSKKDKLQSTISRINYDAINGDKIIKFIISKDIKKDCLLQLEQQGVSKDFLFPPDSKEDICKNILDEFEKRETTVTF